MNDALRKIAFFIGLGILFLSIYWSQDGFNFKLAGDAGYGQGATVAAYFLAISVCVIQFIFSSDYVELNLTLIFFGIASYVYSIYTNYQGILHMQGGNPNEFGAAVLAVMMDAVAEPIIAWSLYESRRGDLIGNLLKAFMNAPRGIQERNKSKQQKQTHRPEPPYEPTYRPVTPHSSQTHQPTFRPPKKGHNSPSRISQQALDAMRSRAHVINELTEDDTPSRFNL